MLHEMETRPFLYFILILFGAMKAIFPKQKRNKGGGGIVL